MGDWNAIVGEGEEGVVGKLIQAGEMEEESD